MPKTIALFGAGTGLGASVARRFGREGYQVALVARREEPLRALAAELEAEGITSAVFTADLTDTAGIPALVEAIRQRFGRIDVVEYAPISTALFAPATELDAANMRDLVNLYLLTPVELVKAVLPEMIERGDGAILIGQGFTAVQPLPFMSGVGPVMAAARNYVYSLNGELADKGVYVGTLTITAVVTGSAGHQALMAGELISKLPEGITMPEGMELPEGMQLPIVDPDVLAELYWELFTKRDRVEEIHPPMP